MRKIAITSILLGAFAVLALPSSPAHAQSNVTTYVASSGTDANNNACSRTAPCLTFTKAISLNLPGGTIHCIDQLGTSGFPHTVTITKSITIDCKGIGGDVNRDDSNDIDIGFVINGAGIDVTLRGLNIASTSDSLAGPGRFGVEILQAATVNIEDCTIRGFSIPGGIGGAIYVKPASGVQVKLIVTGSHINNNQFGIVADGTSGGIIQGLISDSFITSNINNGITVATTTSNVVLSLDNVKVVGNAFGLAATGSSAGMLVGRSIIATNATGLYTSGGGVLFSYGDNRVNGNPAGETFSGTVGQK